MRRVCLWRPPRILATHRNRRTRDHSAMSRGHRGKPASGSLLFLPTNPGATNPGATALSVRFDAEGLGIGDRHATVVRGPSRRRFGGKIGRRNQPQVPQRPDCGLIRDRPQIAQANLPKPRMPKRRHLQQSLPHPRILSLLCPMPVSRSSPKTKFQPEMAASASDKPWWRRLNRHNHVIPGSGGNASLTGLVRHDGRDDLSSAAGKRSRALRPADRG